LFSFVVVVVVAEGVVVVAVAEGLVVVVPEVVEPVVVLQEHAVEAHLFEEYWRRCGCSYSGSSAHSFEPYAASS